MADNYLAGATRHSESSSLDEGSQNGTQGNKIFSQAEVDELMEKHGKLICFEYDSIISNLREQLSNLSMTLMEEDVEKSKRDETIALFVKEAHLCPFNCFKDSDIKQSERTRLSSLPSALSGQSSVAPTSQINFVSDKHFKTSLILQKRLENAEKELIKAKQNSKPDRDSISFDHQRQAQQLVRLQQIIEKQLELVFRGAEADAGAEDINENRFEVFAKEFEEVLQKQKEEKDLLEIRIQELEEQLDNAKGAEVEMNEQLIEKVAQAEIALNESKLESLRLVEAATLKQKKEYDLSMLFSTLNVDINSVKNKSFMEQLDGAIEKIKGLQSQLSARSNKSDSPIKGKIKDEEWNADGVEDADLKQVFELFDFKAVKSKFIHLYQKMKEDKEYAEKTAIDTKLALAETAMSRDYYEHNFVKLLKRVK